MYCASNFSHEYIKVLQKSYINSTHSRSLAYCRDNLCPLWTIDLLTLLHDPLQTMVVPQKYHPMVWHSPIPLFFTTTWYLQALEMLHRDLIECSAGMSWRPKLCAVVMLSRVQLSIMCRAQYGISIYVSLSGHWETWLVLLRPVLSQTKLPDT